ncbi:hypothetical protein [Massilia sp. 9096]|nr:hypothetical protein [Massilia sp. 9096]
MPGIGTLGPSDLLVRVIIANASQNAMADDCKSVSDDLMPAAVAPASA